MKTINEIKQKRKEINDKMSELYECDLIKTIKQKREEIRLMLDEIYNQDEKLLRECEIKPFSLNNINWKFAIDNENINVYYKSDYDFYEVLVCCHWLDCGSFYFAVLKQNQEFKKLIEEYNNFIDEVRG